MLKELFNLSGRTALVTGGSKGIGKAVARGLAEAGANIAISARHEDELKKAQAEIADKLSVKVSYFVADMQDRAAIKRLAADVLKTFGRCDVLFNNAGSNKPQALVDTTDDVWDNIVELNLTSCMLLSRELAPAMVKNKWGRIIYTSSIMGLASNPARGCYSATKAALIGMARAQALELGPHGITVNCLAPGPIATDLPMSLLSLEQKKIFSDRTAVKRWGQTVDMVGPVLMLATDAGAYVTGNVVLADGGILCRTFD
ncbi:MAG TPA: SDR family oxidoreductase [Pirellulaceae bacterium]|jgi:NAD(P)-dependent dehydrogenase (short-subunit alcohol dehydrogenase family)